MELVGAGQLVPFITAHKVYRTVTSTTEKTSTVPFASANEHLHRAFPGAYDREVRLGTASMVASTGVGDDNAPFIDSSRLDLRRYARRPALAMVLADYLVYVERNPRKVSVSSMTPERGSDVALHGSCGQRDTLMRRRHRSCPTV